MMPILREGRFVVFGMLAIALAVTLTQDWRLAILLYLVSVLCVLVFRQPARPGHASPLAVLSPVDGYILSVGLCRDPYCGRSAQCVRLVQARMGPYGLYAPIEGKLMKTWRGEVAGALHQAAIWMQTDEGDDIVMAIHPARLAGYLYCRAHAGERIGHGSQCGFAGFGRVLDLYLPETSRIDITAETPLRAGEIIGKLRSSSRPQTAMDAKS